MVSLSGQSFKNVDGRLKNNIRTKNGAKELGGLGIYFKQLNYERNTKNICDSYILLGDKPYIMGTFMKD